MTQADIKNIQEGDYIYWGSRWHRIHSVTRKGEKYDVTDYSATKGYGEPYPVIQKEKQEDKINVSCTFSDWLHPYDASGTRLTRPMPDEELVKPKDSAFPKCKHCEGTEKTPSTGGKPRGNYLLLSEIMDIPDVRDRIEKKFTRTWYSGRKVRVEPRFRIIDDRVRQE